jgi:hypothetical protein
MSHISNNVSNDVPYEYLCPITLEIMSEPVICEDGNTYEKKAITEWLSKRTVSPITNQEINPKNMFPNITLKKIIEEYKLNKLTKQPIVKCTTMSKNNFNYLKNSEPNTTLKFDSKPEPILEIPENLMQIFKDDIQLMKIEDIIKDIDTTKFETKDIYFGIAEDKIMLFYEPMKKQDIQQLNWLVKNGNRVYKDFYLFAIVNKLPKVIKWLVEINCSIPDSMMNLAVELGNKNLVFWLLVNGCKWNIYTFSHAIQSVIELPNTKSIDCNFLTWLLNKGCFWGILLDKHKKIIETHTQLKDWFIANECIWKI